MIDIWAEQRASLDRAERYRPMEPPEYDRPPCRHRFDITDPACIVCGGYDDSCERWEE